MIPVRHDIEDLKKFLNELNELTTRTDKRVYFLASSGEYNSAVLNDIYLPSTVKFKLYEKISPYEKADIDFVESFFVETYPNQPELFKNRFEEYKREHFGE